MSVRHDDQNADRRYFRSSARVLRMNGAWYFLAREGEQGPYPTEAEALFELRRYVDGCQQLSDFVERRTGKAKESQPTATSKLASVSLESLSVLEK